MVPDSVFFSEEIITNLQGAVPETVLDVLSLVTFLGNTEFFIVFLTVYYWGVSRKKGMPLLAVALTTAVVSAGLKEAFGLPRPPETLHLVEASHYGLPSGHAMSPLLIYGALLYTTESLTSVQKAVAGFLIVVPISLSRIFLGVHYPADTLAGWFFGGVLLAVFVLYAELETKKTLGVAVAVSAPFLLLFAGVENILFGFGGLTAVAVGWLLSTDADSLDVYTVGGAVSLIAGLVIVVGGWSVSSGLSGVYVFVTAFVIALFVVGYPDVVERVENKLAVRR
ncbi:MAG: phosphatase PAP2 family protein [Halobacteriales archaeon]|nr:phosphatase PAP2 family protein [Halobacteriales archaeon]